MKTTGERLVKIETDIDYIKTSQKEIKTTLDKFIEHSENKFASKWVEKGIIGIGIGIIIFIIQQVLRQVLR